MAHTKSVDLDRLVCHFIQDAQDLVGGRSADVLEMLEHHLKRLEAGLCVLERVARSLQDHQPESQAEARALSSILIHWKEDQSRTMTELYEGVQKQLES